jgi:putative molybdopterin biosynthesis protein
MEDERRSRASSALVPSAQPRFAPAGSLPLPLVFAGSDDVLLARLAQETNALWQVNGSTAGLAALASSNADVAGAHLREPDAAEFNISFVQHLIAEQDVLLVQLAVREYGLLVAPGNPNGIRRVRDLARDKLCLLNRARGSGARLWLLRHLRAARLDPATLSGWTSACTTYDEIARAIVNGKADVGPGLRATAEQYELDFVPLGTERFDLAVTRALYESRRGDKLQEVLHRKDFLAYAQALPGYDVARSGRVIAHIRYGQRRKQ